MRKSLPRTALSPFKRYWWIAIPAFLASMSGAVLYLAFTPRLYQAVGRMSVEDERTSVSDIGQTLTKRDELGGANPIVTQAEVVKSQGVLREALAEAQSAGSAQLPSVGWLMEELQVSILPATNLLEVSYRSRDPEQAATIVNAVTQAAVAQSVEDINLEATSVRNFLESQLPELQTKLQAAELAESEYRQENGLLAVAAQNQQMVGGLAALEQEERALLSSLAETVSREQQLQNVVGIDSPEAAYDVARVGQDPQLETLRSQITSTSVAISEARSMLGDEHPDLLALNDEIASLQALYQQRLGEVSPFGQTGGLSNGFGSSAAALSGNDLSQQFLAEFISIKIEAEALVNRLSFVQAELAKMRDSFTAQPSIQQPLAVLGRERQEAADSLALIQSKLEEARIAEAQLVSNVRVVGLAEAPENPVSPSPLAVLALGAIAGSILTIGTILLLDVLDASLQSGDEAEKLVKLPVLGYLPRLSTELLDIEGLDAFLDTPRQVEPYRALLKTIESRQRMQSAANRDRQASDGSQAEGTAAEASASSTRSSQVIVVSSPTDNEGKSSVATCLGAVSAMLGRRTLIVEADPQNPVQHTYLQVEQQPGLTDLISQVASLADVLKLTTIGRLSVLPYGQMLNRPSTVTESPSMRALLNRLGRDYDLVIIDTAPADRSADAATVGQLTDGLLLVTRPGYTPRSVLAETVQQLRKSGAPLLGIAMNETILLEEQMGILPRQITSPATLSNR